MVNTLEDPAETPCTEITCSLRYAIFAANEGEDSTIEFGVAGTLELNFELPAIEAPMTIDATTAPGYKGAPVVELPGGGTIADGLVVEEGGSGSTIEGLAINGFDTAILLASDENHVCANYIGTGPSGETADPNAVGVVVAFRSEVPFVRNEIGYDCAQGNLISGSEEFAIEEIGEETWIGRNLIEGNAAGIYSNGNLTLIGGSSNANTIARNQAPGEPGSGVVVASPTVTIRNNSIFGNDGPGIVFEPDPPVTAAPLVGTIETTSTFTRVKGTVSGDPNEIFALDFFANDKCDASGAGEGKTYLQSNNMLKADGTGVAEFQAELPPQPEGTAVTVTATGVTEFGPSTSAFSKCIGAPAASTLSVFKTSSGPTPENGKSVVVSPKSGKIFITLPGSKEKVLLKDGQEIPVGSIIDATRGKVTLTSIDKAGNVQTAVFFGGVFKVKQRRGSGLVVLELRDSLAGCKRSRRRTRHSRRAGQSTAAVSRRANKRKRRRGGRLWGSGKGRFRTKGHYGAATVRGTIWLTEDRCGGTFFKVKRGVVTIRDFGAKRTFPLRKGKSYLAKS